MVARRRRATVVFLAGALAGISLVSVFRQRPMDLTLMRAKLASGTLPWIDWERVHIVIGGLAHCAGCDTSTSPVDLAVECHHDGRRVTLHPDCYVMWEEARAV